MKVICPDGFTVNDVLGVSFEAFFYKVNPKYTYVVYILCCFSDGSYIRTTYSTCSIDKAYTLIWSFRSAKEFGEEVWEVSE